MAIKKSGQFAFKVIFATFTQQSCIKQEKNHRKYLRLTSQNSIFGSQITPH